MPFWKKSFLFAVNTAAVILAVQTVPVRKFYTLFITLPEVFVIKIYAVFFLQVETRFFNVIVILMFAV